MSKKENDFLKKLLSTFKIEAEDHINAISAGLIELEKVLTPEEQAEIIETVFREAHSLKGAARAVNMMEVSAICQSLESIFAGLKRKEIALSSELFDILRKAVNTLDKLILHTEAERTAIEKSHIIKLIEKLKSASEGAPLPKKEEFEKKYERDTAIKSGAYQLPVGEKSVLAETVRISTAKLESLLLQAEELLSAKLAANQRVADLRDVCTTLELWKKKWTKIYPEMRKARQLLEKKEGQNKKNSQLNILLEFVNWNHNYINSLESKLKMVAISSGHDSHTLSSMVDDFLDYTKKALMVPFSSLLMIFPRFIREFSHEQGKEVELIIHGGDIEIDRRILEEMKDPLIHLVRNCVDHAIEKPTLREQKRKSPRGKITISISPKDSNQVEILISDDGIGIDLAKVKAAAVRVGIVSQEEAEKMNEQETLSLIFLSGVSTSPIITDISGRGLGLAIVKEKVEKLGGTISLESLSDIGTTFRIVLPVTFATFRGVVVCVNEHLFVLPTNNIQQVVRINKEEIKTVENKETIQLNGQAVSLVRLGDVLELPGKNITPDSTDKMPVVILASPEKRIAFLVDEIFNEQEVLVKSLGRQLLRVRNIAGATVLGTGKVVPILNVSDLLKSAVKISGVPYLTAVAVEEVKAKRKSILVVEDSITARTLLKNIMESAGYDAKTAVDGVDAWTALKVEDFDLVVSDVDMPRMNGFELTMKIRGDKKLADLPVVLVTALESREDRERGIDAGANAYIIKSTFDQSNLLEVIRRLI